MSDMNSTSTDPVCGRIVDPGSALYAELYGQSLYFCSESCRQRFCPGPPVPGQYSTGPASFAAGADDGDLRQG